MPKARKQKGGKPKRPALRSQEPLPMVALYGLDAGSKRGDTVRAVAGQLGFPIRTIGREQLGCSVGAIAGIMGSAKAGKPYAGEAPNVEFMLLSGLSSAQLDQLLAGLRNADAGVAMKAQVTQHNRFWPLHLLISEIAKEHEAMTQGKMLCMPSLLY